MKKARNLPDGSDFITLNNTPETSENKGKKSRFLKKKKKAFGIQCMVVYGRILEFYPQ